MLNDVAHTASPAAVLASVSIFALLAAIISINPLAKARQAGRTANATSAILKRRKPAPCNSKWRHAWSPAHLDRLARMAGWSNAWLITAIANTPLIILGLTSATLAILIFWQVGFDAAIAYAAFAGLAFATAPYAFIQAALRKRRKAITNALPDALDLLAMVLSAGLNVEQGLRKLAVGIAGMYPELAHELRITLAELQYLPSRKQAYQNLEQRTNAPGLEALSASLLQASQSGVPLARAIAEAAAGMRAAKLAEAERRAASLPAKLAAPLVIFFMPAIFVVVLVPAVLRFLGER